MRTVTTSPERRLGTALAAVALGVGALVAGPGSVPAHADTAPTPPAAQPATVTADALPTVQVDGVVWSQVTVGTTVYATGSFTAARPAGAAAGTDQTPRADLLAYDIRTGELVTSFAHTLDAQGLALAASPDGSRVYVGGDFTTVDGRPHHHVAAFDTATGALVDSFAPDVSNQVRAITATDAAVYVGGTFSSADGRTRGRLAAFAAAGGSLLDWAPTADGEVRALVLTPDRSRVVVGGRFTTLAAPGAAAVPARGLGAVDAVTAAVLPWAANQRVQDSGDAAGITSLRTDGRLVYGTGYVFGGGGNLEGSFAADPDSGRIAFLEDCHGDSYDTYPAGDVYYLVGHPHACATVGGFPETTPRTWHRGLAFTTTATGTLAHNSEATYADWYGSPSPTLLTWYPTLADGTVTGQHQAAWSATGGSGYVALGGEFPTVNGTAQQGLVRFAVAAQAPRRVGPVRSAGLTPTTVSQSPGTVRVSWHATSDPDDATLTYTVLRDGSAAPIATRTVTAPFWALPELSLVDTGLQPGSTHTYRVAVRDPSGNTVGGATSTVQVTATPRPTYVQRVLADGATHLWRLDEPGGTTAGYDQVDAADDLALGTGTTRGTPGAVRSEADTATTFDGTANGVGVTTGVATAGPSTFTVEAWVRTRSTSGGKVLGFGSARTGNSAGYDRHLYLDDAGHVVFGVHPGTSRTLTSPGVVDDGAWHHLAASLSAAGTVLYVDGTAVARDSTVTAAQSYSGYWRIGQDNLASWPDRPTSDALAGDIDEVATYPTALSADAVAAHHAAGTHVEGSPTTAAATATATGLSATLDGTTSDAGDGATLRSWAWDLGDGTTATGVHVTHRYATTGTRTVTLTVTDSSGRTARTTRAVTVTAPATAPVLLASDWFGRSVAGGFGRADNGGSWTTVGTAADLSVASAWARVANPVATTRTGAYLPAVSRTSTDTRVTVTTSKLPAGDDQLAYVLGRRVSADHQEGARLRFTPGRAVTVSIVRFTTTGAPVATAEVPVPGVTYAVGRQVNVRLSVVGSSPTTLRVKAWANGTVEPAAWQVSTVDATAGLQSAGTVGLAAAVGPGTTNRPVTVLFARFSVYPGS